MARGERVDRTGDRLVQRHRTRRRRDVGRAVTRWMRSAQILGGPGPAHTAAGGKHQVAHLRRSERLDREIQRLELRDRPVVDRHQRGFRARSGQDGPVGSERRESGAHGRTGKLRLQRLGESFPEPIDGGDQVQVSGGRLAARHPLRPALHEPERGRGVDVEVVEIRPHRRVPEVLRDQPLSSDGDPAGGDRWMRPEPFHAARGGAEHQLVLAREPAQRQPEQSEGETVKAVSRPPHRSHRRASAQVEIEPRDLFRRGLANEPDGEHRLLELGENANAPSGPQVELGELLRNGRAALWDSAQVSHDRADQSRGAERRDPPRPPEEGTVFVSRRRCRHQRCRPDVRRRCAINRQIGGEERRSLLPPHSTGQRQRRDEHDGDRGQQSSDAACHCPVPRDAGERCPDRWGKRDHFAIPIRLSRRRVSAGV